MYVFYFIKKVSRRQLTSDEGRPSAGMFGNRDLFSIRNLKIHIAKPLKLSHIIIIFFLTLR